MSPAGAATGRRFGLITFDQFLSGGSNVLIAVFAARLLDVRSFGLFGVVFLSYTIVLGFGRALVNDPVLIHPVEARQRTGEVIGTGCLLGLGLGLLLLYVGGFTRLWIPDLGNSYLVLAACMPALLVQDLGRYLGFAMRRPGDAVALDLTWLVLQVAAVAVLFVTDTRSLCWTIAAWCGSGALSALVVPLRIRATVRLGLGWLRFTWGFSWRYLASYAATQVAALGVLGGVGVVAGARDMGGLQGSLVLIRPYGMVQAAAMSAGVSHIAQLESRAVTVSGGYPALPETRRVFAARISAVTAVIAAVNATILVLLPDRVGRWVLGQSWDAAVPLLLPTGLQIILLGLMTGMRAGLLGSRGIRRALSIDLLSAPMVLTCTLAGAAAGGAATALWLGAVAQAGLTVLWWRTYWAFTSERSMERAYSMKASMSGEAR